MFDLIKLITFIIIYVLVLTHLFKYLSYKNSDFGKKTGHFYFKVLKDKGVKGEYDLYKMLIKIFPKENVFPTVYIKNNDSYAEIDIVVLTNNKIYVIETKNMYGDIFGSQKERDWLQVLNRNTRHNIYNPLMQANNQLNQLRIKLDLPPFLFEKIVVFNKRTLSLNLKLDSKSYVILIKDLKKLIKRIDKKSTTKLRDNQYRRAQDELNSLLRPKRIVKKEHLKHAQERKRDNINIK